MPRLTCPKCGRTYWDDERHICLLDEQRQHRVNIPLWAAAIPALLLITVFTFAAVRNLMTPPPTGSETAQQIFPGVPQPPGAGFEERPEAPRAAPGAPRASQPPVLSSPHLPAPPTSHLEASSADHPPGNMYPALTDQPPSPDGETPPSGAGAGAPARRFSPPPPVPRQHPYREVWYAPPRQAQPGGEPPATAAVPDQDTTDASHASGQRPEPAAGQPPASTLHSTFFPLHLGESRIYFAEGHLQRMLLLYANLSHRSAPQVRLVLDLPHGFQMEKVVMVEHPDRVRTRFTTASVRHGQEAYMRYTIPMFTIPAHFRGAGPKGIWDQWMGWWSYLYVTPRTQPGSYRIYWSLQSPSVSEPERSAEVEVLPPVPSAQVGQNARVGAWLYRLLDYQEDSRFEQRLIAELRRIGVGKIALALAPLSPTNDASLLRANRRAAALARKQSMTPFGVNWWNSWASAPRVPPAEAMATTADGRRVPAWCPGYIVERGPSFRAALQDVSAAVKAMGVDGFTLDYRTAFAPDFAEKDICFDARCRHQFQTYASIRQLNFPQDVLPGSKYRRRWVNFRAYQRAEYAKALGEAVWAANKNAVVETWTASVDPSSASDNPYTLVSSSARQLAPRVNRVLVSAPLLSPSRDIPDMSTLVKDIVNAVKPTSVTVGVMAASPLNAPMTSHPDPNWLNYQVLSHIADGAAGIDLWGLGVLDDGRYAHLISRWSTLLALAEPYVHSGRKIETATLKMQTRSKEEAVRLVAYQRPGQQLVVLLNSAPKEQTVRLFPTSPDQTQTVWDLLSGQPLGTVSSTRTLRVAVSSLNARFLTTRTSAGGWQVAVKRFLFSIFGGG